MRKSWIEVSRKVGIAGTGLLAAVFLTPEASIPAELKAESVSPAISPVAPLDAVEAVGDYELVPYTGDFVFKVPVSLQNVDEAVEEIAVECAVYNRVSVFTTDDIIGKTWKTAAVPGSSYADTVVVEVNVKKGNTPEEVMAYTCSLYVRTSQGTSLVGLDDGPYWAEPLPGTTCVRHVGGRREVGTTVFKPTGSSLC